MAAPAERSIKDLSGKWTMNKTLSDDLSTMLQMQNVGWILRQAIKLATVTLSVNQYVDADSKPHIDIAQTVTGGIQGSAENRTVDWTYRDRDDKIFGSLKGRSRFCRLSDVDDDVFVKEGFEEPEGEFMQSYVESYDGGWTANQVWGFEVVGEGRRYVRRIICRKGEQVEKARVVYDYQGPNIRGSDQNEDDGLAYEG